MLPGSDGPSLEAAFDPHATPDPFLEAFEYAPLPMALVEADDRIRYANPAFSRLAGHPCDRLAGMTLSELTHPDDRDEAAAARRSVLRGEVPSTTTDIRLLRCDGGAVWALLSCGACGDAGRPEARRQVVVQLVDVGERKQVERELTRSNAELSSFAFLAAHELKSPLQSVNGFTALLDRIHGPRLDPQGRELIRWILDGAGRMEALVDALLAYCVVDRAEAVLAPVALDCVLTDALAHLASEVTARGAAVTAGALPVVTGDPVQLGQLLHNLLSNAMKFVPEGRPPEIQVSAERTAAGWTITVADNGIGVEDGARQRIFTMFERLHPRERYHGTGIGLSICKRIVERRGGTIWVEPNRPGGSRFRFEVPDAVPPRTKDRSGSPPPGPS